MSKLHGDIYFKIFVDDTFNVRGIEDPVLQISIKSPLPWEIYDRFCQLCGDSFDSGCSLRTLLFSPLSSISCRRIEFIDPADQLARKLKDLLKPQIDFGSSMFAFNELGKLVVKSGNNSDMFDFALRKMDHIDQSRALLAVLYFNPGLAQRLLNNFELAGSILDAIVILSTANMKMSSLTGSDHSHVAAKGDDVVAVFHILSKLGRQTPSKSNCLGLNPARYDNRETPLHEFIISSEGAKRTSYGVYGYESDLIGHIIIKKSLLSKTEPLNADGLNEDTSSNISQSARSVPVPEDSDEVQGRKDTPSLDEERFAKQKELGKFTLSFFTSIKEDYGSWSIKFRWNEESVWFQFVPVDGGEPMSKEQFDVFLGILCEFDRKLKGSEFSVAGFDLGGIYVNDDNLEDVINGDTK